MDDRSPEPMTPFWAWLRCDRTAWVVCVLGLLTLGLSVAHCLMGGWTIVGLFLTGSALGVLASLLAARYFIAGMGREKAVAAKTVARRWLRHIHHGMQCRW